MWELGSFSNKKIFGNSNIRCNCGKEALIRTMQKGQNLGIKFYGCPLWPDTHCEFFRWVNEHTDTEEQQLKLDEKTKKLHSKKAKFEEDLKHIKNEVFEMRIEIIKCSRKEKNMYLALLFSWIFFW
ncbi:DNA topoisomerase 3-alpha, partial [Bienertia sinuspersici]